MMRINAHVPTQQYGFIELTDLPDDPAEVQAAYNRYAESPIQLVRGGVKVDCFVGGSINYDPQTHTYTNDNGDVYLSGSQFAKQSEKPFNADAMSGAVAKKFNVDPRDVLAMWKLKGDVSAGFGTAIHAALELYGKYAELATSMEKTTHLHDHPIIKSAVELFFAGRENERAIYEAMIVDHSTKHAGQVDRLLITKRKHCRIQDYKTNANIEKDLAKYWIQLGFYADIMRSAGWVVEGADIFHWNGEWHTYKEEYDN